ncbi:MAG: ATP-dependent DNA ligase [Leifsonia sp.]
MGHLVYDSSTRVSFDDRLLAQLQVVIVNKLRRKESFAMSWKEPHEKGGGRTAIWIDVALPLRFSYEGSRMPAIDREWVERLAASAASPAGLIVTEEDGEPAYGWTHERGM